MTVCPHGLGNCGDNVSPLLGGNTNPLHTIRNITLSITDTNNIPVSESPFTGKVKYVSSSQNFQGTITVPNLPNGKYLITLKMDGFLVKQILGIISVTQKQQVNLPAVSLVTGDINNDNKLDISDYSIIVSCFEQKLYMPSCPQQYRPSSSPEADIFDDDGQVDGTDYNLFIREFSVQQGQ